MEIGGSPRDEGAFVKRAMQAAIGIGLLLLLIYWCFTILKPFLAPIVWGIVIAVATYPLYLRLQVGLGGRRMLSAALYVVVGLLVLIAPSLVLAGTLVDGLRTLASAMTQGSLVIPAPPQAVETWPLIGEPLYRFWDLASTNLQAALGRIGPELNAIGSWMLAFVGQIGIGLLHFVVAIFIAAALLANAAGGERVAHDLAVRLVGERGSTYVDLARATIRSVARGIIGIALLQAILAGLGFLAVGIPAAGLLALVCLILIVLQVGPVPVLLPAVIYVFSSADTVTAIIFLIWCVFVTSIDNVLKPLLLGRGVNVPMLVIFLGAIGGVLSSGILGLFVGPVVLALGYSVVKAWLDETRHRTETP